MRRTFVGVMVMVTAIALFATAAIAATVICSGGLCEGTPDRDEITGSNTEDEIRANESVDLVAARGGSDEVRLGRGGTPADMEFVEGGFGHDKLGGGRGGDELNDFDPSDINDTDLLSGGKNDDFLFAQDGDDNDTLDGGPGADDCFGDPGDRIIDCEGENSERSVSRASGDTTPRVAAEVLR
jgi:Ca2+-binding RTX toxin-like protein